MARNRWISLAVALIGAAVTAALWSFNRSASTFNSYLVGNMMGLFWVPLVVIVLIFRENPDKYGFTLGFDKRGIWPAVGIMFGVLMAVILISRIYLAHAFQDYYPIFKHYPEYQAVFGNPQMGPFAIDPGTAVFAFASYGMYMFCWEFFFRGFLLRGLERSIGFWAILVQAVAFGLLHIGKPPLEVFSSFGAGIILGILALRSGSFMPCFILHWAVSLGFDLLVIAGSHKFA